MKIAEFGTLQMIRSDQGHFGNSKIQPLTVNQPGFSPIAAVKSLSENTQAASLQRTGSNSEHKSFQDYLLEAVNNVNTNQMNVAEVREKLITNPDEVDVHDVTIAMQKASMSLSLAQTIIDRLVTDWNEISTTR